MEDALNNGKNDAPHGEVTLASLMAASKRLDDGVGARPVEDWNPDHCGEMDLVIKRDGTWWHEGSPLTREPLRRLFASVLRKDDDGQHYLVTPVEKIGITVEIAAFMGVRVDVQSIDGKQTVFVTTNFDETVRIGPEHALHVETDLDTGEPIPLVRIRGRLDALLTRPAFYELVDHAEERAGQLGIMSGGAFYVIGKAFTE